MKKTISWAATLALGLFVMHSVGKGASPDVQVPTIVARVQIRNQTQAIPSTIIFTPGQTGTYRISTYMVMTTPNLSGVSGWTLGLNWNDRVGVEQTYLSILLDNASPPSDFGLSSSEGPEAPFAFEAVAGQPISYFVLAPSDKDGGTYELVLIVEQLAR